MGYQIDTSKGQMVGAVSAQWANRPEDQRFTSLTDLRAQVAQWADESRAVGVLPREIKATYADTGALGLQIAGTEVAASHWSFDQLARSAGAPANYLRSLPAPLAAINLNYGLQTAEPKAVAAYVREPQDGTATLLRGLTSTRYGRILDRDVADAVMQIAGNGTGDTRWKVPGTIDWSGQFGVTYNPEVEITKQNTTLYASDRDIFLFLVDDMNPVEVGKLANGAPDLMFRGFYVWNSEVGSRTFGFAAMYLRGVCQNRNLWGVENFSQMVFKHTAGAPERFPEVGTALTAFANNAESKLIAAVKAAKGAKVATSDEERLSYLAGYGFSEKAAQRVIATCLAEEQTLPESVWDFAQGVSALARREDLQEERLKVEQIAGRMLDKASGLVAA